MPISLNALDDITICLGCARKLQSKLVGVSNYCCQKCTLDSPCKEPTCAAMVCGKCKSLLSYNQEEGYECFQCQREIWNNEAKYAIKGFKCPVCLRPVIVEDYDAGYVSFRCEYVFDSAGYFAKQPCPVFRVQLCEECNRSPCICQEYPEQESEF